MNTSRLRPFVLVTATAILISCGDGSTVEPSATPETLPPGARFVALVMPSDPGASPAGDGEILFRWNDNSEDESGFEIQRSKGLQGPFSLIAKVKANVTEYLDSGLASEVEYCYRVRAFSGKGKNIQYSSYTATVDDACATTNATDPIGDPRPTGLTATPGSMADIILEWQDNWDSETHYAIERCVELEGYCYYFGLALVAAGVTSYTDADVTVGLNYCYRVKGLRMKGRKATYTEYSNVACAVLGSTEP